MFLHIGNGVSIRERDILGIFDADTATVSAVTRQYLAAAARAGRERAAVDEVPRSFVVYRAKGGFAVCFSQLSPAALAGRTNFGHGQAGLPSGLQNSR